MSHNSLVTNVKTRNFGIKHNSTDIKFLFMKTEKKITFVHIVEKYLIVVVD